MYKLVLLTLFFLFGCVNNYRGYIQNSFYKDYYKYLFSDNISIQGKQLKMLMVLDKNIPFKSLVNRINLLNQKELSKLQLYVVLLYPDYYNNIQLNPVFDKIDNLSSYLINEKKLKTKPKITGISDRHIKDYKIFVYYTKK